MKCQETSKVMDHLTSIAIPRSLIHSKITRKLNVGAGHGHMYAYRKYQSTVRQTYETDSTKQYATL